MQLATNVLFVGDTLAGNASASSDRDGSIVAWDWDFGDTLKASGASVSHVYTNSGTYEVRLTVVDNEDAERSATNTVYVSGVRSAGSGFTILNTSITNCPACDPTNYPTAGSPFLVDWETARGFFIRGTPTSGSTKVFRITFPDPVPAGLLLYRLPGWTRMSYTLVDPHTLQVELWLNASGSPIDLQFVLAKAAPLPTVTAFQVVGSSRFSLRFATTPGYRYVVQQTPSLLSPDWAEVKLARASGDPATLDYLDGTGAAETVFVDLPGDATAFFRIRMRE